MPAQKIRRRNPRHVVSAAVLTGVVSYAVTQSVIGHVLPELQRQLHTNQRLVPWVMTGYLLSASVCTPIAGRPRRPIRQAPPAVRNPGRNGRQIQHRPHQ